MAGFEQPISTHTYTHIYTSRGEGGTDNMTYTRSRESTAGQKTEGMGVTTHSSSSTYIINGVSFIINLLFLF